LSEVDWIKEFSLPYNIGSFYKPANLQFLRMKYDLIVSCGSSVGYLYHHGVKSDVFIPFGYDLYHTPFVKNQFKNIKNFKSAIAFSTWLMWLALAQNKGIKNTRLVISNQNWTVMEQSIQKIGASAVNLPRLMVYNKGYLLTPNAEWTFLQQHDFIVFSQSRHYWKSNPELIPDFEQHGGLKRNDKLIHAFARFIRQSKFKSPILILFAYGYDVEASKNLIDELGIERNVKWMPIMDRKSIMSALPYVSLGADQFRQGWSGTSGGSGSEILAASKPLITYTNGAINDPSDPFYGSPIIDALEEEEIINVFLDYELAPQKYENIGRLSGEWFDENLGVGLAKKYLKLFTWLYENPLKKINQNQADVLLNQHIE
ncbi:MAG TPA: hypothetical protein VGD31_12205, partial [Sphingobacteriaceae bacterium]